MHACLGAAQFARKIDGAHRGRVSGRELVRVSKQGHKNMRDARIGRKRITSVTSPTIAARICGARVGGPHLPLARRSQTRRVWRLFRALLAASGARVATSSVASLAADYIRANVLASDSLKWRAHIMSELLINVITTRPATRGRRGLRAAQQTSSSLFSSQIGLAGICRATSDIHCAGGCIHAGRGEHTQRPARLAARNLRRTHSGPILGRANETKEITLLLAADETRAPPTSAGDDKSHLAAGDLCKSINWLCKSARWWGSRCASGEWRFDAADDSDESGASCC